MSATATKTPDEKKLKALAAAVDQIKRDHSDEAIIDMSGGARNVEAIPTGSLPLDIALGVGGVPKGRIIEIYGPESSGKTTFCYHVMAAVQQEGGIAAFIDAEHSMDPVYAANLGLNVDDVLVSQPDHGEQGLQICEVLANSGAVDVIVIDSVAALVPRVELEGNIGDTTVGLQARLMSQALRKLSGVANRNGTTIIFTNQLREKIGVSFGSPETTSGGRALKFYASVRLDIRRIETLKKGTDAYGNRVRVKVVKNKVAPPYRQAEFDVLYGQGFDSYGALVDMGVDDDIAMVKKSGSFFEFVGMPEGDKKPQGKPNACDYLREHPEIAEAIDTKIRKVRLEGIVEDEEVVEEASEEAGAEVEEKTAAAS